ncbi:hypothetical protein PG990_011861 [Apiospora arundinis]
MLTRRAAGISGKRFDAILVAKIWGRPFRGVSWSSRCRSSPFAGSRYKTRLRSPPRGAIRVPDETGLVKGEGANQVEEAIFDRIVLAIDPHAVARIYAPLRSIMSGIPTRRVESAVLQREGEFTTLRVAKHPYEFNKIDTAELDAQVADTLLLKSDFTGSGYTEALHTVSCGAIVATSISGQFDDFKVLHRAAFWRVLRTPKSREIVNTLMRKRLARPEKDQIDSYRKYVEWHNGENNVWLAGGWCWDGMVLLEGCIVSAIQVAQDFGVRTPWDCDLVD